MYKSDVTQEMISLMRGFFAMPVISALGKLGVIDEMLSGKEFSYEDFSDAINKEILLKSFRYLTRLGLLQTKDLLALSFNVTDLGREIFQRHRSFYVPHSYNAYMHSFEDLLKDGVLRYEAVDRLENVVGSGLTHQRYFLPAVSFLKRRVQFDLLADVGCGNGYFLKEALRGTPVKNAVGVDLSPISVRVAEANLKKEFSDREIIVLCSDAMDVEKWGNQLQRIAGDKRVVLSMWFLIHEISRGDLRTIINFLKTIYRFFPHSPIVLGELIRHPEEILAKERAVTIMPEYLFFHELSGQGILSWDEYQQILASIPYKILCERLFDELPDGNGKVIPSAFVWCMEPVNSK